jgi:hypothetical protein
MTGSEKTTPYLAVRCNLSFHHIVALMVLDADLGTIPQTLTPAPFEAVCKDCKSSQRFFLSQLFVWQGPPPRETFQTHPAFR